MKKLAFTLTFLCFRLLFLGYSNISIDRDPAMLAQVYKRAAAVIVGKAYLKQNKVPLYTDVPFTVGEKTETDQDGNRVTQNGEITATILDLRLKGIPIDKTKIPGAFWSDLYYWPANVCCFVFL